MSHSISYPSEKRDLSVLERMNKTEIVYLCIDCEQLPCLGTASYSQACEYARQNNCTIIEYPIGRYTEDQCNY